MPSKTRLASLFEEPARQSLVHAMLTHLLSQVPHGVDVAVITRSPANIGAVPPNVTVIQQEDQFPGLNGSLRQMLQRARDGGYNDILMLPADLPLVQQGEISSLLLEDGQLVIAGDRDHQGTNGLRVPTRWADTFHFGMGLHSFQHHLAEARKHGVIPVTVYNRGLAHDLDTPDDWFALPESAREALTAKVHLTLKGA